MNRDTDCTSLVSDCTEGALHGDGIFDDHIVHPLARGLDGDEGAADDVGRAGAGAAGGDAALPGKGKGLIQRPDGVDGAHLGGDGIDALVVVHALPAHGLVVQTDVAVGFHQTGGHQPTFQSPLYYYI